MDIEKAFKAISILGGYSMYMQLPDGRFLVRYLIPQKESGDSTTGVYSEGVGTSFDKAIAAAVAGLPPSTKRKK